MSKFSVAVLLAATAALAQSPKPITLDAYFGETTYGSARLLPDGAGVVFAARAPDWKADRFNSDLWLWRLAPAGAASALTQLTSSGHDSSPEPSPDGRYIAFLSDRALTPGDGPEDAGKNAGTTPRSAPGEARGAAARDDKKDDTHSRLWLIPTAGGEAVPLTRGDFDIHAFAWASDSSALFFSIEEPLSRAAKEAHEKEWKDVIQYRAQTRGDLLLRLPVAPATRPPDHAQLPDPNAAAPKANPTQADPKAAEVTLPTGATRVAQSPLAIEEIVPSPDGGTLAFLSGSLAHRLERPEDVEIYTVAAVGAHPPAQLTHNQGLEGNLHWAPDSRHLFFTVRSAGGSIEGKYQDVQGRLYTTAVAPGSTPERLGADFDGAWDSYTVLPGGDLIATGQKGLSQLVYRVHGAHATKLDGIPGTYGGLDAESLAGSPHRSDRLLFVHSAINEPTELYVADSPAKLRSATRVTAFNQYFKSFAQPTWKPFTWKADDGVSVEGVLLYPPGMENAQHLPMLTLIHGGPADADGDRFGANWYDWAGFAAANGWLVFRPNYRGSSGYGDAFMTAIAPHLVSRPGKDILEGVDALTQNGTADPGHLGIAGYSYGGYMTNWLITQTTRFKAADTGAGAVEHAANWGNDDLTFDDAWYLGGRPWENPENYEKEAALFQMNKVTTPTHILGGDADVRVSFLEDILLERALTSLGIPNALLVFPGEGHPLGKNPWHGYIALREELKWLNQYAGTPAPPK